MKIELIVILFLLVTVTIFVLLNKRYMNTNAYKNDMFIVQNYRKGVTTDIKFAFLGSTYAKYAFGVLDDWKGKIFNFCLPAESLEMDFQILKEYSRHLDEGACIIISLSSCVMLYRPNNTEDYHYFVLPYKNIPNRKIKYRVLIKYPLLEKPWRVIKIFKDDTPIQTIYDKFPIYISSNKKIEEKMRNQAQGWIKLFNLRDLKDTKLSKENENNVEINTKILKEMLDYCLEHDFKPVIVIPPISHELDNYFSSEFKDVVLFHNIYKAIDKRDIPVLNYQNDKFFLDECALYVDGGFRMNKHGSEMLVKQLACDLKRYNINFSNKIIRGN